MDLMDDEGKKGKQSKVNGHGEIKGCPGGDSWGNCIFSDAVHCWKGEMKENTKRY